MITRALVSPAEQFYAKRIVYDVYIDAMQWKIASGNVSGIQILSTPAGNILEDNFTARSKWYGLDVNNKLVGTCRFIESPNVELELFTTIPEQIKKTNFIELNRIAVIPGPNAETFLLKMLYDIARIADEKKYGNIVMGVNFPTPGETYSKLGLKKAGTTPFSYDPTEESSCYLTYFDLRDTSCKQRFYSLCEQLLRFS